MPKRALSVVLEVFENHAAALRNHYWHIRYMRSANRRRKHYRHAAKEKAQLVGLGYCSEVVRLYALYLRDPRREIRYKRFLQAFEESKHWPRQLTLF